MDYGTGAIFGCPAHDQRDLDFARRYRLDVVPVVSPQGEAFSVEQEAYVGPGRMINSRFLDGLEIEAAKSEVIARIAAADMGEAVVKYRLRDWGICRRSPRTCRCGCRRT
jgi:leucyl-tRNA synthetase